MLAYQLKAKFDAGLVLSGRDEDGRFEFIGTVQQWDKAGQLEEIYAEQAFAQSSELF